MKRNEWRDHWGLSEEEMVDLEQYLKTTGYKILEIKRVE